jgi:diguanylate cyclase
MMDPERALGVICIQHHLPAHYNEENVRALATIAHQASVALQNLNLYRRATRDPLTDLYRRPVLLKRLQEELLRARSQSHPVQIMEIDLDRLKDINDSCGHAAGDIALRQVAEAIRSCLRSGDVAARFGGDEFVVLLPGVSRENSLQIAERILDRLRHLSLTAAADGREIPITVSIGLAGFVPGEAMDPAAVFDLADRALYEAKQRGRDRAVFLDPAAVREVLTPAHWAVPPA